MEWLNLTVSGFEAAKEESKRVCIVPFGCIEKHSEHLPLGTDSMLAYRIACLASEKEPAVVFPVQHYTMAASAPAQPGAIALDAKFSMQIFETLFDEIHRNGFNKIILYNGHGGNRNILPLLIQNHLTRKISNYTLYLPPFDWIIEDVIKKYCTSTYGGHADEWETSLMLYLYPETVHMDKVPAPGVGAAQDRLKHLKDAGILVPHAFFSDYPTHYAGDATDASKSKGEKAAQAMIKRLARVIHLVKNDNESLDLLKQFQVLTKRNG